MKTASPARIVTSFPMFLMLACAGTIATTANAQVASAHRTSSRIAPSAIGLSEDGQTIDLSVRGQMPLVLEGAPTRVAVADPEVADITVLRGSGQRGGQILIYGKKPGTTRIQVWTGRSDVPRTWNVHVITQALGVLAARGVPTGVSVDGAGDATVVSGSAPSTVAHQNAVAAASGTSASGGSAGSSGGGLGQGGRSAGAASGAAGGGSSVIDASTVNVGGVVQVEVKIVEVSSTAMKNVGLSFSESKGSLSGGARFDPAGVLGGAGVVSDGFNLLRTTGGFSAQLNLLQSNGMARILAEPTLVALSGQSASFLSGGEIPVPTSGGLGTQSVEYKPFGIGLTVTPTVLSRDRIALKVAPEASELDPANGTPITNGTSTTIIPALRTRRADTTVELGDGESFVISGLVSRETKAAVSKIPFLGDLPIIGAFFRGMSYSQNDSELIIVVTPKLVRPIARGVDIPLPGDRKEVDDHPTNAWGYFLMGRAGGQDMPGFSR